MMLTPKIALGLCIAAERVSLRMLAKEAMRWYRKAAKQGYAYAQQNIGFMYMRGHGVEQDYMQAYKWFYISAASGNLTLKTNLSEFVEKTHMTAGQIEQAREEAEKWMDDHQPERAQPSQVALASPQTDFAKGTNAYRAKDYPEAARLFRKSAERGYVVAQYHLGMMHIKGQGVAKDAHKAAGWLFKAAEQGHAQAQYVLGAMYSQGEGAQAQVQAHKWLTIASALGEPDAEKARLNVEKKMSAQQIADAKRDAAKWLKAYEK